MLFVQVGLFYCHLVILAIFNLHLCVGFKAPNMSYSVICECPNTMRLGLGDSLTVITNNNENEENPAIVYIVGVFLSWEKTQASVKF